jgi:hypothetical protein
MRILRERLLLEYVLHPRVCIRQDTHTSAYAYVSIHILRERLLLEYVLHPRVYCASACCCCIRAYAYVSMRQHTHIRQHTQTSAYVSMRILRERLLLEYVLHPRGYVLV